MGDLGNDTHPSHLGSLHPPPRSKAQRKSNRGKREGVRASRSKDRMTTGIPALLLLFLPLVLGAGDGVLRALRGRGPYPPHTHTPCPTTPADTSR